MIIIPKILSEVTTGEYHQTPWIPAPTQALRDAHRDKYYDEVEQFYKHLGMTVTRPTVRGIPSVEGKMVYSYQGVSHSITCNFRYTEDAVNKTTGKPMVDKVHSIKIDGSNMYFGKLITVNSPPGLCLYDIAENLYGLAPGYPKGKSRHIRGGHPTSHLSDERPGSPTAKPSTYQPPTPRAGVNTRNPPPAAPPPAPAVATPGHVPIPRQSAPSSSSTMSPAAAQAAVNALLAPRVSNKRQFTDDDRKTVSDLKDVQKLYHNF